VSRTCCCWGMRFPPARGSGVYRIRSWANHVVRNGFDVPHEHSAMVNLLTRVTEAGGEAVLLTADGGRAW
jgi:hypothetical protein